MTNKSQKDRIIKRLLDTGRISRNECLRNYISRLGAIICALKAEGWDFTTERDGGDYVYKVKTCPFKKVEYINPITKEIITTYK